MLTKGAFGNLVNRYRAVLKKCNLINTFGSLAVASMLVLGGAGVASAADFAISTKNKFGTLSPTNTGSDILQIGGGDYNGSYWVRAEAGTHTVTGYETIIYSGEAYTSDAQYPQNSVFLSYGANGTLKIENTGSIVTKNNTNSKAVFFNAFGGDIDIDVKNIDISNVSNGVISRQGASVTIKADENINISTVGNTISTFNDGSNGSVTLDAKNINLNSNGYVIVARNNGNFNINATDTLNISGENAMYIYSGNSVSMDAKTINITGYSYINGTLDLSGDVNITDTVYVDEQGTLKGDATLIVNDKDTTFVNNGSVASTLSAKGSAKLNDQTGGDINTLNEQLAELGIRASGMDEGLIAGAVDANGNQETNTVMQDTLDMVTAAPLAIGRIVMNDVRKRMGDLRDTKEESGVWMRWEGGKLKGDAGLTNNFNTIQIGADTMTGIENVRAGVAAAFTHGDLDHNNGEGENETYSFSAYATWMAENGMFADVIARVGFSNSEVTMKDTRIDLDNEALSLSGEYGWRLPVCEQFYVEPQVELTYTYVTGADSKVQYATYDVDSMDSLIGRAGLVAGWKLPSDMGSVYARASVVHEFLGDAKITGSALGNSIDLETDGKDTWIEYGIGANVKLTDKTYIWADVERTSGADIDEEWRGTVGLRYSF